MIRIILPLVFALGLIGVLSLAVGPVGLSFSEIWDGSWGRGEASTTAIIRDIRLPRFILAGVVGAGLGASGAALQGFTRNDLAAPGLLGFSATAALGAVLALYFGYQGWIIPAAVGGACIGAIALTLMARQRPGAAGLVLAGIGVGALATAVTGLIMNLAPNPWALSELVYWLMGSLAQADGADVVIALPLTALGITLLSLSGPALRVLGLGEDTAVSLGISVTRTQALVVVGTALCIGAGVAVAGAIGFVGLFIPHILRFVSDADEASLIPLSALGGAVFLAAVDLVVRVSAGPGTPLYLGVVTSLIGVPFFLYLALRRTG